MSHALPHDDAAALDALHADLVALHAPADAVEAHWVEEVAFAMWRQRRLRGLESAALDRAEAAAGTDEPGAFPLAPLATLARYRARVGRDLRLAEAELEATQRCRPAMPPATPDGDTGTIEPEPEATRGAIAMTEALPAAARTRTNEPDAPPPPNRRQRRRLEALARRLAA